MKRQFLLRKAHPRDVAQIRVLLLQWLNWEPPKNRINSIRRAVKSGELIVAERRSRIVGFIHYVMHEDIIDGAPNAFITAFYVSPKFRRKGVGSALLRNAIADAARKGAVDLETSTIHRRAKQFYERRGFRQVFGDIGEVFLELDVEQAGYAAISLLRTS